MAKPRLRKSDIIFNKIPHTYEINGKQLNGVTSILHSQAMFRYMYDTEAYKALRANHVWQESGYSIEDTVWTEYHENEQGIRDNITVQPMPIDNLIFACSNEDLAALEPVLKRAQAEHCRIETNKFFAAIRGTAVHEACDNIDAGLPTDNPHASKYKELRESLNLKPLASEYLVSDNEYVASSIDLVLYDDNNEIILADIKCVSRMDDTYISYVSWQLSIYKYLFELQNPKKQVKQLYCVWLPQRESYGTAKMFPVPVIPKEEVITLLLCSKEGRDYTPVQSFSLPEPMTNALDDYLDAKRALKQCEATVKDFESKLNAIFKEYDVKRHEIDGKVTFIRTLPTTTQKFDTARFKEEHPDLYEQYLVFSQRDGSLRVSLK